MEFCSSRFRAILPTAVIMLALCLFPARSGADWYSTPNTAEAFVSQPDDEVKALEFLNHFDQITFAFTEANGAFSGAPGKGHYATTFQVLQKIRKLGYTRPIEIRMDPRAYTAVAQLISGLGPNSDVPQTLSEWNAFYNPRPIRSQRFEKPTSDRPTFAIAGGDDKALSPKELGVDALLTVQPPGWFNPPTLKLPRDHWFDSIIYPELRYLPFLFSRPEVQNVSDIIQRESQGSALFREKAKGLAPMLAQAHDHELLSVYGVSFDDGPTKLSTLIQAASNIDREGTLFAKKGIIVPMFSSFNDPEWKMFFKRMKKVRGHIRGIYIPIQDGQQVTSALRNLRQGEVAILKIGSVPQPIWNHLMEISSIAPTVSGMMGMNFMSVLGKPYINTVGQYLLQAPPPLKSILTEVHSHLVAGNVAHVERFLRQAYLSRSPVHQEFSQFGDLLRSHPDKVMALLKMTRNACAHLVAPEWSRSALNAKGNARKIASAPRSANSAQWWNSRALGSNKPHSSLSRIELLYQVITDLD